MKTNRFGGGFPLLSSSARSALMVVSILGFFLINARNINAVGTWTALNTTAPGSVNMLLMLPDGTVMAQQTSSNVWYSLAPDKQGHYVKGTWTKRASMAAFRLYFATQVLPNGKVFLAGAEHPANSPGKNTAELYDYINNAWTNLPVPAAISDNTQLSPFNPFGGGAAYPQEIGAPCSVTISNGTVLLAPEFPRVLNGTVFYNPANNTFSDGPASLGSQYEASWVKLPDNSILTIDDSLNNATSLNSERYIPSLNRWIRDANVPVQIYGGNVKSNLNELGAALLLPSGKAFFIGGTGKTAIYTPSGTTNVGTWTAGPSIPNNLGVLDGPAAEMPNGKILCVVGNTNYYTFPPTPSFYEYDPVANAFAYVPSPNALTNAIAATYAATMLDLPDGTVLCAPGGTGQLYVYQPDTAPLASSRPIINSVNLSAYKNYVITGTFLNGDSQGASYGDDWQMDGNYPLVSLSDTNGNVYYARSYNWSSSSVQATNVPVTTSFVLPNVFSNGVYFLTVSACGNTSAPVQLTFTNDNLQIINTQAMVFGGPWGGPYGPAAQYFSLTNISASTINWKLSTNPVPWLFVSTNAGSLASGKSVNNIAVTLTGAVTNLGIGSYYVNILVTNSSDGTVQSLPVTLNVNYIVQNGDFEYGSFEYWTLLADPSLDMVFSLNYSPDFVHSGYFGAGLGNNAGLGALYQSVVINTNQTYLLSFWLSLPSAGAGNVFLAQWNNTNLLEQVNQKQSAWVNYQFPVSSSTPTNLLNFAFINGGGFFALDDVFMTPIVLSSNAPLVITQPANQMASPGQAATFVVGAEGAPYLAYQWTYGNTAIAGATNASLQIVAASTNTGAYFVVVSNVFGSVTSSVAQLSLLPASDVNNGDFGTGDFTGWTLGNTNNTYVGNADTNLALINASAYGALLGNSNTVGSLYQNIPTIPGQLYLISFTLANSSGAATNLFNVYWGGMSLLNQTNLDVFPTTTVQLLATAATPVTRLLFTFENDQGYFGLGNITVEPLSLPILRDTAVNGTTTSITWDTLDGLDYQLQYTTNLFSGTWTNLGNAYIGDGTPVTAVDPSATDPQRYYRVQVFLTAPDETGEDDEP